MTYVTNDSLVRQPVNIHGEWFVDGTQIRIADLQRDSRAHGNHARIVYLAMGLTTTEFRIANRFTFPKIQPSTIGDYFVDVHATCECGMPVRIIGSSADPIDVLCLCGRSWGASVVIAPTHNLPPTKSSQPDKPHSVLSNVSIHQSILARAQQAHDRWLDSDRRQSYTSQMLAESRNLGGSIPGSSQNQRAFLLAVHAIREGVGNGFNNQGALMELLAQSVEQ